MKRVLIFLNGKLALLSLAAMPFLTMAGVPAQSAPTNEQCLACHSAPGLSKQHPSGEVRSLHVDQAEFRDSIHGDRLCVDCHTDLNREPVFPHKLPIAKVQCSRCHSMGNPVGAPTFGPLSEYADSVHGRAVKRNDPDAPRCKDCHGYHNVLPHTNPESTVSRQNIPETCAKCHGDRAFAKRHGIPPQFSTQLYKESVHAQKTQAGQPFAVCSDCHGAHTIKAGADPMSTVSKQHIPETCGNCHKQILNEYTAGIHGQALARGEKDAPVCTNCHGEHSIMRRTEEASTVYPTHVVTTCSKCHEDKHIQQIYGLPANRLGSYIDSYHGVANKLGDTTVANCSTCHESHAILPSSDPRSATNKKNIPHTCGKCHPGAGKNFAIGNIHVTPSPEKDAVIYWVQTIYTVFIAGMISSFVGYIALDLFARWRERRRRAS